MFKNFKSIKLPRLHLGSEWNYASWHPYFAWGPAYFCYTPHKSLDYKTTMIRMAEEEDYMGKSDPIHFIEKKTMKRVFKAYQAVYVEGPWLTKADKLYLSRKRKAASALWKPMRMNVPYCHEANSEEEGYVYSGHTYWSLANFVQL